MRDMRTVPTLAACFPGRLTREDQLADYLSSLMTDWGLSLRAARRLGDHTMSAVCTAYSDG